MYKLLKYYPRGFNPQEYWDDRYAREHIAGSSSDEFVSQGFWPALKELLEKDKKYLDAGAGIGGWVMFLQEQGYEVEGIDIAARTIRALTEYDPSLKLKVASITRIPYADQAFDGVLAIGVLEYVEDKVPVALEEVYRVLKPGGAFFLEVPIANTLRSLFYIPLKKLEGVIKSALGKNPSFANYLFNRAELKTMLEKAGFEVMLVQPHELPEADGHYGLYVDWRLLRGKEPYKLNALGKLVKNIANALSPWVASTGVVMVARKKPN